MAGLPLRTTPTLKTLEPNDRVSSTPVSTATKIPNYGKTLLNSSSTTASLTYLMDAPIPGVRKVIVFSSGSTLVARSINGVTTTVQFISAGTAGTALAFQTAGSFVELEGRTSLIWDVLINTSATLS